MFHFVGILLRFPFFLIGVILWTPFAILGFILAPILGILATPFKFIEAAWKNEKWILENHFNNLFKFDAIWDVYGEIYSW